LKSPAPTSRNKRRGAAAVEFALVVPLFVIFILGMMEFGRAMMVMEVMTNAAREGCRTGVLPGSSSTDVTNTVNTYADNSAVSHTYVTTGVYVNGSSGDPSTAAQGDQIKVTVSLPFDRVTWLPVPIFLGGKTLSSSVVMRKESNNS